MPTALVVRAIVANPTKRQAFDEWHKTEMFPAAIKAFGTKQARRSWSLTNPAVHISVYRFDDEAALKNAVDNVVPGLREKADRDWPDVSRTLEQVSVVEEYEAAPVAA